MCENRADHLSNNLSLDEISMLIFFGFSCKTNRNQLEIIVEATYGLWSTPYSWVANKRGRPNKRGSWKIRKKHKQGGRLLGARKLILQNIEFKT